MGELVGVEIGRGPPLELEIAERVAAAHGHGTVGRPHHLADMGRDVADREADPPIVRAVLEAAVKDLDVVQRHLARHQHGVGPLLLADLDHDLLAVREEVLLGIGVAVRHHLAGAGSGHHPHAARFDGRGRERHPGGHHIVRARSPIGDVLVPGDVVRGLRPLGEDHRFPAEDVGTVHVLDGVEDPRVVDQLVGPTHP